MDFLTIIGIALGMLAIVGTHVLEGGEISSIVQLTSAIIVFCGTLAAVFVNYPASTVFRAFREAKKAFVVTENDLAALISQLTGFAQLIRKDGLLALEPRIKNIDDAFLKKAVNLLVDGSDVQQIRDILEIEIGTEEEQGMTAAKVLDSAGGYAPTIGILGAVLGLIHVMENLADPSMLGSGIAVAFVATIYGVGSANLLWIPLAGKMKSRVREGIIRMELIVEGVTAIAMGENPRIIQERLEGFLSSVEKHSASI